MAITGLWRKIYESLPTPIRTTLTLPVGQQVLAFAGPDASRHAVQAIGDAFRALDPALLVRVTLADPPTDSPSLVIPDIRLPAEVQALRQSPATWLVYCEADPVVRTQRLIAREGRPLSPTPAHHLTETAVLFLAAQADFRWANSVPFTES
ncbi:MAG: hypothetical protein OWU84_14140 [Firmicutes bacterium]|nr:hypothetical protein [Bacillota bacterium]